LKIFDLSLQKVCIISHCLSRKDKDVEECDARKAKPACRQAGSSN